MSVNIEQMLENLSKIKSNLAGAESRAEETIYQSYNLVNEESVEKFTETANAAAQSASELHDKAIDLLGKADTLILEAGKEGLHQDVIDSLSQEAIKLAEVAQGQLGLASTYADKAEVAAKTAQEVANLAVEDGGWVDMLLMAGIGFGIVFIVLVLLIYIMRGMGWVFTRQKKAEKAAKAAAAGVAVAEEDHEAISDQEIAAAIMTALKLYKSNLHDQESEMLTIHRITRAYSPWSSKIHGLTQLPERK